MVIIALAVPYEKIVQFLTSAMNTLTSQVQRLRSTLRQEIGRGGPHPSQIEPIINRLAGLVLRALQDDEHPLAQQLIELWEWIDLHRKVAAKKGGRKDSSPASREKKASPPAMVLSEKHLFMPQPGNASKQIRRFWPLQLLLYAVAQSNRRADLAQHLKLSEYMVRVASKEARAPGVWSWSENQRWLYVEQAIEYVEYPDPPMAIRLEGRTLHYNKISLRLSPQRATFLKLLLDLPNKPVQIKAFKDAGIPNPSKTKADLLKQLGKKDIELLIMSPPRAYVLVWEPS